MSPRDTPRSSIFLYFASIANLGVSVPRDFTKISGTAGASDRPVVRLQMDRSLAWYMAFSLVPRGRHSISVCLGTACHVRGAAKVLAELERRLHIKEGETTKDRKFTLNSVNCLGACALGPVIVIDGEYFGKVTPDKVVSILEGFD